MAKTIQIPHNFKARGYQVPFLRAVEKSINGESAIRFFLQIWCRRSGKDKTNIADVIPRRLIKDPCLVKYVYPTLVMGRDNLWNGIGADGFKYLDHIPKELHKTQPNSTRMTIETKNNSLFQVAGSDNPDSLRGGNAKLYVFSEWAEQDPYAWDVVEPILQENNGIAIFNMTPKGDNHARAMYEFAKDHPRWYVQTLKVTDTDMYTPEKIAEIKEDILKRFETSGRSTEEALAYFEQEYMCSFESPVVGSYYGAALRRAETDKRLTRIPYESTLPVHTVWDLGVDDSTTIWFYQATGREIRLIDYYENSGEGLPHYANIINSRGYSYGKHWAPHDIEVRELGTGKSRKEIAKSLGINFTVVPNLAIEDGIESARALLSKCYFDSDKCNRGIQALKNYRKDWDEKNKVLRLTAKHDWSSHGADAFRYLAVSFKDPGNTWESRIAQFPKQQLFDKYGQPNT